MNTYTATEASKKLNVSSQTVKRWIQEGKLNGHKENGRWYVQTDDPTFDQHLVNANCSSVDHLRDEIRHLRELLERRDRQIESMSQQIDHLSQLLAVSHKSLQQVTDQYHFLIEDHRKPSFWKRLFRRPKTD